MTDEKKNTSPDDEYQFPQDEYVSSSSESVPPADGSAQSAVETAKTSQGARWARYFQNLPQMKNKRIILVIVVVIAVIIAFRIINSDNTPVIPPVQTQHAVVQEAPPVQQPNNNMLGSLDSLKAHSSQTESQIKELQGRLTDMQNSLNQSQTANQDLQKSVATLTAEMQALSTDLHTALEKIKSPVKGKQIIFHLRAVVPDRAWIISSKDETVSVTVGDHIKQYGTVRSIDAQHGVIETSSGRKIEYGPNDY